MKSIETNKDKKKKVLRVLGLVGLFVLVFGLSYALFRVVLTGKKKTRITTANFGITLTDINGNEEEEGIAVNIENALPETDEEGLSREGYKFVVTNTGNIPASYELKINGTGDLSEDAIKYALIEKDYIKGNSTLNGMHSNETKYDSGTEQYIGAPLLSTLENDKLDATTLLPGEKMEYELKMWLAEDATIEQASNKTYEANIVVEGSQAKEYITGKSGDNIDYVLYKDGTLILDGTGETYGFDFLQDKLNQNTVVFGDIIYKYLTMNNIDVDYIENVSAQSLESMFLAGSVSYITQGVTILDDTSIQNAFNQYLGSEERTAQVLELLENFNSKISRVVVNEGITQVSTMHLSFVGDYMVSLPSTLTSFQTYALQFYDGYTIVLPQGVKDIHYETESNSSFLRCEYVDLGSVETVEGFDSYAKEVFIPNTVSNLYATFLTPSKVTVDNTKSVFDEWDRLSIEDGTKITYLR